MPIPVADCRRLLLLIQRILDADVLCDTQGIVLLTATEAACRSLEKSDLEAARQQVAQVARFTEALLSTGALAPVEGRAVIETAHRILVQDTH